MRDERSLRPQRDYRQFDDAIEMALEIVVEKRRDVHRRKMCCKRGLLHPTLKKEKNPPGYLKAKMKVVAVMLRRKLKSAPVVNYIFKPLPGHFSPIPHHKIGSCQSLIF